MARSREASKRALVHAHVLSRPGSSSADAAAAAEVTHPTASYHLLALAKRGEVESHRHGNRRLWFESGRFDAWERQAIAALRSRETTAVLEAVWASPWTYLAEVAGRSRVSRLTVTAAVRRLADLGLVAHEREGRTRTLVPERGALRARGAPLAGKLPRDDPAREVLGALMG